MLLHPTLHRAAAAVVVAAGLTLAACGSSDGSSDTTTTSSASTSTTAATTTTTTAGSSSTATTGTPTTVSTTGRTVLEQPAIWPASNVGFDTPAAAAADFVAKALEVPVNLGEFQQGDSRSGEIELLFRGEGSDRSIVRSVLALRQLGPDSSWFVLAAMNDNASITSPEAGSTVPAGPLTVTGKARGFEGAVNVTAFVAGDATRQLDEAFATAGSLETPEPFTVTLDLSGAEPGDTVAIVVRGGVGLETDPGETGAIPVVIAG